MNMLTHLPCPSPGCNGRLVESGTTKLHCSLCGTTVERPKLTDTPTVTEVDFTKGIPGVEDLIGFVHCTIDGHLRVELTVVTTATGPKVMFPTRRNGRVGFHQLVHPVNESTRAAIEQAVLAAIAAEVGQ